LQWNFDFSQNIDNMIVATATKVAAPEQLKLQVHNQNNFG